MGQIDLFENYSYIKGLYAKKIFWETITKKTDINVQ